MQQSLYLKFLFGILASLSYSLILELRGKTLFLAALGGGLSWQTYSICVLFVDQTHYLFPYMISALVGAIYAEIMARIVKKPATVFLISAMLPLVPGLGIYNTMDLIVKGENAAALACGIETLAISGTLAIAMLLTSSVAKIFTYNHTNCKN